MRLLHSELELVVKSGFVYVPLLFDPDIAGEVLGRFDPEAPLRERPSGMSDTVIELEGKHFIRSVDIHSVLENYERIDRGRYEQLKKDYLRKNNEFSGLEAMSPGGKLQTIIFKVMPHFIRKSRGLERRGPLNDEELLDLICSRIEIPEAYSEQACKYLDGGSLLHTLSELDKLEQTVEPLEDGPVTGEALGRWLYKALGVQIVTRERARLMRELHERERFSTSKRNHFAALLYIADRGSLELDGFGFSRIGSSDDYYVYKRTGEYILKDYYARSYRFPDCRVAVSTTRPFRPLVLESYKHPFLQRHAAKQEICLRGYNWPEELTAENIIRLLEDGITALLHGYDARRRNGYHSLDPTLNYVKTIEFVDYRI